jgi:hypothetical protein
VFLKTLTHGTLLVIKYFRGTLRIETLVQVLIFNLQPRMQKVTLIPPPYVRRQLVLYLPFLLAARLLKSGTFCGNRFLVYCSALSLLLCFVLVAACSDQSVSHRYLDGNGSTSSQLNFKCMKTLQMVPKLYQGNVCVSIGQKYADWN